MNKEKSSCALDRIGARIRVLRRERGMTQESLAGGDVTRNMLSRIENGAALPSLPTLCAIANRLNVPAGVLLGDFEEYSEYKAQSEIKELMGEGKYAEAVSLCETQGFESGCDDSKKLFAAAALHLADKLYREANLTGAAALLNRAEKVGGDAAKIYVLRELIASCSALDIIACDTETEPLRAFVFDNNAAAIYLYAKKKIGDIAARPYSQPSEKAAPLLEELSPIIRALPEGFYKTHIEAKFEMLRAEYLSAKTKLLTLETPDTVPALLWEVYTDLEFCCKCCGDFVNAYKYSGLKLELIKKIN